MKRKERLDEGGKLGALAAFIGIYERRHGAIDAEEIRRASQKARRRAVPIRRRRSR